MMGAESEKIVEAIETAETVLDTDDAKVEALARLHPFEFDRQLPDLLKGIMKGVSGKTLKAEVEKARKRLERSNGNGLSPTGAGTSDGSNGGSNAPPVRTLDELHESARTIIESPDVLALVRGAIEATGYAGDPGPVVLTYVAITSRLQEKPINAHIVAQAASGKNFVVNTALLFIPEEAVLKMTASSPKALIHSDYDLSHKTIILAECDSLLQLEGNAASLVRSIVEDARTDFDVAERNPETGRSITRRVSKEGPTGLITTGVRDLEFQLGTRMLTVHLSDSQEQTRAVLRAEAAIAEGTVAPPDPQVTEPLKDFQRWLAAQSSARVIVPYATILATKVPATEVRMRRDFKQLLSIVKAIALLNLHHRARTDQGAIIADLSDYQWARSLILSTFKSIVSGGLTDAVRATIEAVPEGNEERSEADLVRELKLSKSTIHYRVSRALKGGWLTNLEKRRGYPFRLCRGGPLPENASPLPTVDELCELFEHPTNSNAHSNGPELIVGVRQTERAFECSNDSAEKEVF